MGTRGQFGFFYKGFAFIWYNQYDSYPSYLGMIILSFLKMIINNDAYKRRITHILDQYFHKLEIPFLDVFDSFCDNVSTYDGYVYNIPQAFNLFDDVFLEYNYIIDFDNKFLILATEKNKFTQISFENVKNKTINENINIMEKWIECNY